jgi:tetratricopeptide (TPR) repeat protein
VSIQIGRLAAAYALSLLLTTAPGAQPQEASKVRIELRTDEEAIGPNYVCLLDELRSHQRFGVADLQADSAFSFHQVPYGDYQIVITSAGGVELYQQSLTVNQQNMVVSVTLPKPNIRRPPSGPVSMTQLLHPPAAKAISAAVAGERFAESGDYRRAAEELEKAIRISPDFAEAYTNLAAQHIRLGEYERAAQELERAMEIAKPGPVQLCNLAFVQLQLKRYDEATESARASLRLDGNYVKAHYLLGVLLARDRRTLPEAIPHLEQAAKELPSAEAVLERARKITR